MTVAALRPPRTQNPRLLSTAHSALSTQHSLQRQSRLPPGFQSSRERTDLHHPSPLQHERHPGARGFIRSRAVEDDLLALRDLVAACLEVLDGEVDRPGDAARVGLEVVAVAEVDDDELLARSEFCAQILR